jgi:hypothetical protein
MSADEQTNEYASRSVYPTPNLVPPLHTNHFPSTGQSEIPVQTDEAAIEQTEYDADTADSDKQLGTIICRSICRGLKPVTNNI